jgi:serine/threonine protein kinase
MGEVYLATQLSLGRAVALKRLSAGAVASARQIERFRREATSAGEAEASWHRAGHTRR